MIINKLPRIVILTVFILLVFCGLIIPSDGNHGILNPKSLTFILTGFFICLHFFLSKKIPIVQIKIINICIFFFAFLLIWLIIAVINNVDDLTGSIDQLKLFIITFLTVIFSVYLINNRFIKEQTIIKAAIYLNFSYSFCKILVVMLHVLGILNIFELLSTLGFRFMSTFIYKDLIRMQTSVDIVTSYLIFFVLNSNVLNLNFTKKFKWLYITISVFSVLLSFSRYLIFCCVIAILLYWLTISIYDKIKSFIILLFFILLSISILGVEPFVKSFESRSMGNYESDLTRVNQTKALMQEFEKTPLFGKGLGGYVNDQVRDEKNQHSYEVQWVAFLMQFGILGTTLLVLCFALIGYQYLCPPITLEKVSFFLIWLLWVLSGFTNPFLISLTSGVLYSLFYLAGRILNNNKKLDVYVR